MSTLPTESDGSRPRVRTNVRRVALGATLLALVVYIAACLVADTVVIDHLDGAIDGRLAARLEEVIRTLPRSGPSGPIGSYRATDGGDLDDAPIVLWWVPPSGRAVVRLDTNAPALPASARAVSRPINAPVAGQAFRLSGITFGPGRIVAGTSAGEADSALSTLLAIEAILAPIVLITLYGAASLIGRRAVAPIERSRRRQLEFTADASHELRTPLSVIEAEVGLALSADRSTTAYRTALQRVSGETQRLRDIVDDLLWLARLDAVPAAPPSERVDLSVVAEVCTRRFAALAASRGITVSSTSSGEVAPIVVAPPEWLDRLVSVLVDNGCRYANAPGRVEVSVAVRSGRVHLTVDDNGPGIAAPDRERIFQRFHRASPLPGGAGLGLSIADAVVKATGGSWEVGRAPLGGARVAASWPLSRQGDERRPAAVTLQTRRTWRRDAPLPLDTDRPSGSDPAPAGAPLDGDRRGR